MKSSEKTDFLILSPLPSCPPFIISSPLNRHAPYEDKDYNDNH